MALDVDFVRQQFPAFSEPSLQNFAHFENAGGSYAAMHTISALTEYYTCLKVQPYAPYPASAEAGRRMDSARERWAAALNVGTDEMHFGPSTSQNTYVMAQAVRPLLTAGDEVIVTNQDHEANSGVWRRMADNLGLKIREWRVDTESGSLSLSGLDALLCEKTRLVCAPHCSNIVGERNPVKEISKRAHKFGAFAMIDGVSWAPHELPDVNALGADAYFFSLYKVYGVHQGAMVVRKSLSDRLDNQGHFFNAKDPTKILTPAGPDHAQIAAAGAVLDYVEALATHHGISSGDPKTPAREVSALWRAHETALLKPLLDFLHKHPRVRLIGPAQADGNRVPTVAFAPQGGKTPEEIATELGQQAIGVGAGHFYAYRLIRDLGLDVETGVVRLSFVHYTRAAEIERLIDALDGIL